MLALLAHPLTALTSLGFSLGLLGADQIVAHSTATDIALYCGIATTVVSTLVTAGAFALRVLDRRKSGTVTLTSEQFDDLVDRGRRGRK